MQEFRWRMGRFLVVMGVGLLVLFGFSDYAQDPHYTLFFWGLILLVVGGLIMRHNRPEPQQVERFRLIRKWLKRIRK